MSLMKAIYEGLHGDDFFDKPRLPAAAWTAMLLRTSTKRHDMIFSMMHLLGTQVPVDYKQSPDDLLLELVRRSRCFPTWMLDLPIIPG